MSQVELHCEICRAYVDVDDLFCSNCGTEAPLAPVTIVDEAQTTTHNFSCNGCGASMSYDASAQTLRCPFCGSEKLDKDKNDKTLRPKYVVPFQFDQNRITSALRDWMGRSFWRPSDLAATARITNVTPVYVPYWIFKANTITYWTADSSAVPYGASGDWVPATGHHRGQYRGILVGASSVLTQVETSSICPFNLDASVDFDSQTLQNFVVEQFRVQRKYARPVARHSIETLESEACRKYVQGRTRNVKVNVRLDGLVGQPVLLPVWVMAYRYKGEVYRFLANGQTGNHTGTAPVSWSKVIGAIAIALVIFVILILIISSIGVIASAA